MASCKYCNALLPSEFILLFCPNCGAMITNLEKEMEKIRNQNIRRADMKLQTFFAMIPFINLLAAYRIRKLKISCIIYSILIIALFLIFFVIGFRSFSPRILFVTSILLIIVTMVYFIRKWTRQWNKHIDFLEVINKNMQVL